MQQDPVVLDSIAFDLDEEHFRSAVHLDRFPAAAAAAARELWEQAAPLLRPKALYRVCYVQGREKQGVRLRGVQFRSRVLAANLAEVDRVFAYVATCGTELEQTQRACQDPLAQFWLDALKELALGCARQALRRHIGERFLLEPAKLCSMNPGSGDRGLWPITEQAPLFRLLGDVEGTIGVRLTDSFLMIPNKTVSGILFPSEVPFESCQLCARSDCPRRRAPFTGRHVTAGPPGHA